MKENAGLKKEIIQKTERIRELDNELLPFRNLSVQELRSSDTASLKKLAELMGTFKKDYLEAQEKLKSQQEDIERLMEANKEFEGSFSKVNRRITSEQKKNLIALFTQLPKTRIIVTCHSMAPEARNFSNEIIDIFEKSGFDTEIIFRNILLLGRTGQFIAIKDKENYPSCAGIIQNAFTEIGLVFQGQLDNETSINSIAFNIYDKAP